MDQIKTLCVIDDDDIYIFTIKRLVKVTGIAEKTMFFENGQTAIDYFRQNTTATEALPDLVLLDLNMPILDGWQFIDQYLVLLPGLTKKPVIYIVSSSVDEADFARAESIKEITGFVVKPISPDKLKEITANL